MIYADNNATTAVAPEVLEALLPYYQANYGNPSSAHALGRRSAQAVHHAREQLADLIRCEPEEIVFTGSGTEADNTAIYSALQADTDRRHIITTKVEHSAIMRQCESLARRGYEITWLNVSDQGLIDLDELSDAIRTDTALVSIMWANNETGVLSSIAEVSEICQRSGTILHTDAVQAVGKIPIDLANTPVQYLAISGHKFHAPKGVGALYINRRTRFHPMVHGGGQENKRRGGTENVAAIVAIGKAAELAGEYLRDGRSTEARRDSFEKMCGEAVAGLTINGRGAPRLPNTSSVTIEGVDSEALLIFLDQRGVCCSAGSACTSGSLEPSHVLRAMGLVGSQARASLRFSFSRYNSQQEIDQLVKILEMGVERVRSVRPGVMVA